MSRQLIQPTKAVYVCANETCVYPFNLLVAELYHQGLVVDDITDAVIVESMKQTMVSAGVDKKMAQFITRNDRDIGLD